MFKHKNNYFSQSILIYIYYICIISIVVQFSLNLSVFLWGHFPFAKETPLVLLTVQIPGNACPETSVSEGDGACQEGLRPHQAGLCRPWFEGRLQCGSKPLMCFKQRSVMSCVEEIVPGLFHVEWVRRGKTANRNTTGCIFCETQCKINVRPLVKNTLNFSKWQQ